MEALVLLRAYIVFKINQIFYHKISKTLILWNAGFHQFPTFRDFTSHEIPGNLAKLMHKSLKMGTCGTVIYPGHSISGDFSSFVGNLFLYCMLWLSSSMQFLSISCMLAIRLSRF